MNLNAEFNLMAVSLIMTCFSWDHITKDCQRLEASAVYPAPPFVVEILPGGSNRTLHLLPVHMHAQAITPTFVTLNIYIRLRLSTAVTLTRLWWYKMFEVLLTLSFIQGMCL